jgi:GLPGLI family protein
MKMTIKEPQQMRKLLNAIFVFVICFSFSHHCLFAQYKTGKILFERKTNLLKKFKGWGDWIQKDEKDKIDQFEFYFNDTISIFKPVDSDVKERMSWATSKNTVVQNLKTNVRIASKDIWNETVNMQDSIMQRKWILTDDFRKIAGLKCRKAFTKVDDTTKIYAWYADEIMVSSGPESYGGLPGMILGLATADGGVVYFAKSIDYKEPERTIFTTKFIKGKIKSKPELKAELSKSFGDKKWAKNMIREYFVMW